jgi:FkbM family methyltransferase
LKIRNLFQLLGFRGRSRRYLYHVADFVIQNGTVVRYAQWLHPAESPKQITGDQVLAYREFVRPGDFCIDIGAHTGDSTLPMAIAAGPTGFTLALEPNPFVYHVLEKNARANRGIANIHTMMAAATQGECFMQFEYSDSGFCNGGRHEGISPFSHGHAFTLDVFGINLSKELRESYGDLLPRLRFVKVDAEGYDLEVVRTIQEIIREFRPHMKVEVYKKSSKAYRKELFSIFLDSRYSIYKVEREPIGRGPLLSLADVDSWKHYDILCVPDESQVEYRRSSTP